MDPEVEKLLDQMDPEEAKKLKKLLEQMGGLKLENEQLAQRAKEAEERAKEAEERAKEAEEREKDAVEVANEAVGKSKELEMAAFLDKLSLALRARDDLRSMSLSTAYRAANGDHTNGPAKTVFGEEEEIYQSLRKRVEEVFPAVRKLVEARDLLSTLPKPNLESTLPKPNVEVEKKPNVEVERCLVHPIAHLLLGTLEQFLPDRVHLFLEPLTVGATIIKRKAQETGSNAQSLADLVTKKTKTPKQPKEKSKKPPSNPNKTVLTSNSGYSVSRKPDAAFYHSVKKHTNLSCIVKKVFLPIELKKTDAAARSITGLIRDKNWSSKLARYGLGGDGSKWEIIDLCSEEYANTKYTCSTIDEYVQLLLNILTLLQQFSDNPKPAVSVEEEPLRGEIRRSFPKFPISGYHVKSVIHLNQNSFVLKMAEEGEVEREFVAKFNHPSGRQAVAQEKEILEETKDVEWIIPTQHNCTLNQRADTLCMTEEGKSLQDTCMCDSERSDEVYTTIERDVKSSLTSLHSKGYIFGDLHPGNILIAGKGCNTKAVLSDFESVRKIGPYTPAGAPDCVHCRQQEGPCWRHAPLVLRRGFFKKSSLQEITAEFDFNSLEIVQTWVKSSAGKTNIPAIRNRQSAWVEEVTA